MAKKSYRITTEQVLKNCGIRSGKTLTRWRQAGLLPSPSLETHPSGRGKTAFYPVWICDWIRWVQSQQQKGLSLSKIVETIDVDWNATESEIVSLLNRKGAFRTKISDIEALMNQEFRSLLAGRFAECCSAAIYEYLQSLGVRRPGIADNLIDSLMRGEVIDVALMLLREGKSPVVAFGNDFARVTTERELMTQFSLTQEPVRPVLVMPVGRILLEEYRQVEPQLKRLAKKYAALAK